MTQKFLVHPRDISIDRDDSSWPTKAVVYDADGEFVGMFDKNTWTDDHIIEAICFANKAFAKGHELGLADKAAEIRIALGITTN